MKEERIYQSLFENSAQGMVLLQDEKVILVNQSFCDMVGYANDEILNFSVVEMFSLVHSPDCDQELKRLRNLLAGKETSRNYTCRFIRRSGETGWWSVMLSRIEHQGHPSILGVFADITERKSAEKALERGFTLLNATLDVLPVGVCLTDKKGYYRMMNDAYCTIYDYDRDAMIGQHYSVIMPPDQIELANAHYERLLSGDTGIPVERKRQRKDGSIIYIEAANALVEGPDGQKMVITTVRDITERKRMANIMQMRLRLWEIATNYPVDKLMQMALDEIGEMTGSPIGFYHFVNEDQNALSLQAWSTRTVKEFCQAEGKGLHYPISEAGVWTDCVHERKPVIHNDYPSLPHRKGMPEGHAEVIRELVVPTMRGGKVVAILGVGNKPSDYDERDVELVSYIADLVWSIVEQKRADEQIRQLNTRLEHLAMIDELTGVMNRRSFFIQGENEATRARRYDTPFSLLLLDVDGFKNVNDRYGHDIGDLVLQHITQLLVDNIRETDKAARMGGEEFSVLLPNTGAIQAFKLAERVRLAIERENCQIQEHTINTTVSIGVATFSKDRSELKAILRQADASMYQAKKQGRNQVVFLE